MSQAANHVRAIQSILSSDTPCFDPRCHTVAARLVMTLRELYEPHEAVKGDGHARALQAMLLWSGDHDFDAVIGAGGFRAELQSTRETVS